MSENRSQSLAEDEMPATTSECERCEDLLEHWVDWQVEQPVTHTSGDVPVLPPDVLQVQQHLPGCESCSEDARWALEVRRALADLPQLSCPTTVLEEVERTRERLAGGMSGRLLGFAFARGSRPAAAPPALTSLLAAAALIGGLALAATWLLWFERPREAPARAELVAPRDAAQAALERDLLAEGFSREDLVRAEREAKVALAVLGAVSQRAGLVLRDEVLRDQVALPPRRALSRWAAEATGPMGPAGSGGEDG